MRFYATTPLLSSNGNYLGSLCMADDTCLTSFGTADCSLFNNLSEVVVRHMVKTAGRRVPAVSTPVRAGRCCRGVEDPLVHQSGTSGGHCGSRASVHQPLPRKDR